jgi:hypothetical protein
VAQHRAALNRLDCKRSASIGLPQRCHRVPPKCTAMAQNLGRSMNLRPPGYEPRRPCTRCISAEYGGTRGKAPETRGFSPFRCVAPERLLPDLLPRRRRTSDFRLLGRAGEQHLRRMDVAVGDRALAVLRLRLDVRVRVAGRRAPVLCRSCIHDGDRKLSPVKESPSAQRENWPYGLELCLPQLRCLARQKARRRGLGLRPESWMQGQWRPSYSL